MRARRLANGRATALGLALLMMACGDSASSSLPPERPLETLQRSARSISLSGSVLSVDVDAWRSHQPLAGEKGDPLLVLVRLRSSGGPIPNDVAVEGAYLVHGTEVVPAALREENPRASGARLAEFMIRDGPMWKAGEKIDVVVALRHAAATTMLLRSPPTEIARVD